MFDNEQHLTIQGPVGKLELVLHRGEEQGPLVNADYCAVVCHPHPLHGGTMDNKVVTTLVKAYRELGVPTVRFNFRGVGKSEGHHDDARGEVEDLLAVAEWAREQFPDSRMLLAGFSFGSSVASNGSYLIPNVVHLTLVAPPVGRYRFSQKDSFPCPACVVMGDRDELVDAEQVYHWAERINPAIKLLRMPEATHFFHRLLVPMRRQLVEILRAELL